MTSPLTPAAMAPCELCTGTGGRVLWQDGRCRVVSVPDGDYPGFCRVIWNTHARELTDLSAEDRDHLMGVVWATESAVRRVTGAHKINLASLGNVCPHVHWHVIPRHAEDAHFPAPVWAERKRLGTPVGDPALLAEDIRALLAHSLGAGASDGGAP